MRIDVSSIAVAMLLATAGSALAAPPAAPRVAQATTDKATPEDLPTRPKAAKEANPLRHGSATADVGATETDANKSPDSKKQDEVGGVKEKGGEDVGKGKGCGKPGCTVCSCQVPTCKPKWEDKKTKKAKFTMKCDFECARPWEPYHQGHCCEEKTTPCGDVYTKKKLFKTEEEKVERVLKYEVVMKPAPPCCDPAPACCCLGCRCLGDAFQRIFSWCH